MRPRIVGATSAALAALAWMTVAVAQEDPVPGPGRTDDLQETGEVVGSVHLRHHEVPGGPGALRSRKEPVAHFLRVSAAVKNVHGA